MSLFDNMKKEVTTMPALTLGQWDDIQGAISSKRTQYVREFVQETNPRKREIIRRQLQDVEEINSIISPIIQELKWAE
jgi:hypothetical protein